VKPGAHRFGARRRGDTVVAAISGELDMNATFQLEPELERVAGEPGVRNLALDLRDVEFIDSAGLGLLLAMHDRLRAARIGFRLENPSPSVRRMLQLTGAGTELPVGR
jgi:anti-anti-sigma factor